MFQHFDSAADTSAGPKRVAALRERLQALGVDAFLVPRADEHQGEYVPPAAERLRWLTGFTGSAGLAIVSRRHAALVTDGRYTLQARGQIDAATFEIVDSTAGDWIDWLAPKLKGAGVIGYDPRLHTAQAIATLKLAAKRLDLHLKAITANPVDRLWGRERPLQPTGAVSVQPIALSGVAAETKIANLQAVLKADKQHAVVLTLPDSLAWLFNIRGSDVAHNPVPLAFAIVHVSGKPELFIDPAKLGPESRQHCAAVAKLREPGELPARLADLRRDPSLRVRVDPASASAWIVTKLGRNALLGADPCIGPKARKSMAELQATRRAHIRDGAAVTKFLAWFDVEAETGQLDEITAVRKLEACRAETNALKDISFDTISGSGPNGAIVHYRVTTTSNRKIRPGELFLIDSGGQYLDGTTDITRTVAVGTPTKEMRERFTLVLKGHIALATARFPVGTRGVQLDTLARAALWRAGLDFDHGTGHGVGSFLSVHEGPQSISKRGNAVLEPGMIVSNEPGYYKEGAYGIRIENLLIVTPAQKITSGDREMLGFETLTFAPIDHRLVVPELLSADEIAWFDAYHEQVRARIGARLDGKDRRWLYAATRPLE